MKVQMGLCMLRRNGSSGEVVMLHRGSSYFITVA